MICHQLVKYGEPLVRVDRATPKPVGEEVLLRVTASGICHSDLHLCAGYFDLGDGKRLDLSPGRRLPLTLGHEIAGEVEALGSRAQGVVCGARRIVYPWIGCRACQYCINGDEHLCSQPLALGVVRDGGFADYVIVPHSRYLFDCGDIEDSLACTYACSGLTAYSALMKIRDKAERHALLVIGAGGVGGAAISLARTLIDTKLIVADISSTHRRAALNAGADAAVDPRDDDVTKKIRKFTGGEVAAIVDFVGSEESAGFAVNVLSQGGVLVVVGLFGGILKLRLPLLPLKQLTVRGSYVGSLEEMASLIALVRTGNVTPIPLIARGLDDVQVALDDLAGGQEVGRIVLKPHG